MELFVFFAALDLVHHELVMALQVGLEGAQLGVTLLGKNVDTTQEHVEVLLGLHAVVV